MENLLLQQKVGFHGLNKIYYRQFVTPTATIQRFISPRIIEVDNAKVFRVGYKIIFGTDEYQYNRLLYRMKRKLEDLLNSPISPRTIALNLGYRLKAVFFYQIFL